MEPEGGGVRRLAIALVVALAVIVAPSAVADGPVVTYTITAGTAGDNGWYKSAVTVKLDVTGNVTGSTCPLVYTFKSSSDNLNCTATDGTATTQFSLHFNIDTDAPTVASASVDRPADSNGWYNHPVTVTFVGSDATSGIASCTSVTYSGPDSGTASVGGVCKDKAGNTSNAAAFAIKYDSTPPTVTASPARAPDDNDWYSRPVQFTFTGTDATSGIASCAQPTNYAGPDNASATATGSCTDQAGNTASASSSFHYDATGPKVTVTLARKPDAKGWYTHPVVAKFSGTDAVSGLASCEAAKTFKGPDSASDKVTGTCRDKAGNSASGTVEIRYDGSGPKLARLVAELGDRSATLSWKRPTDIMSVKIVRRPGRGSARSSIVYSGKAATFHDKHLRVGTAYHYTLTSRDIAGNTAVASLTATPRALYAPSPGAHVRAGARLAWVATHGARYYNVQLFRGTTKVLSTWPVVATLRLPQHWSYAGKTYTLRRGTYHWYVWPGIGARAQSHYGKLLGGSYFVVK
jgi:hypothetical protein